MKKLMIAAAIVCAAVISQGSTALQWKIGDGVGDGYNAGKGLYSGDMYLFNANESGISQQAILSALLDGGALTDFSYIDLGSVVSGQMSTFKPITDDAPGWSGAKRHDSDKNLDFIDYFYATVATDGVGDKYVFLSETFSSQVQTSKNTNLFGNIYSGSLLKTDSGTFTSTQWYSVVPEPTSGLLLLLGVAGLALRRRRA